MTPSPTPRTDPYQARLSAATECLTKQQVIPAQLLLQDVWLGNKASIAQRLTAAQHLVTLLSGGGQIEAARSLVAEAQNLIRHGGEPAAAFVPLFNHQAWRLSPFWWDPIQGKHIRLRRATGNDAGWIKSVFSTSAFAQAVNKAYAKKIQALPLNQLTSLLDKEISRPPVDQGSHMVLFESCTGSVVGLACLVAIDAENKRAEFIIGFPESHTPAAWIAESFTVFLCMAFEKAGLHKLTAFVYEDNPRVASLIASMNQLGFQIEGIHREHCRLPDGQYIDMHSLALLDRQYSSNAAVQRLIRRYVTAQR